MFSRALQAAGFETDIARAIVDLNRAPTDLPPGNPDGVVKTETTDKTLVYKPKKFPDDNKLKILLNKYYYPYHKRIDEMLNGSEIVMAFDCHSMLSFAPPIGDDAGTPRPLVCLSNGGNESGEPISETTDVLCPPEWRRQSSRVSRHVGRLGRQSER